MTSITLTDEQADVVEQALSQYVDKYREFATDLIENTHLKQAGFNQLDRVNLASGILRSVHDTWPHTVQDEDE